MSSPTAAPPMLPVERRDSTLVVRFPVADHFRCTEQGCSSIFKAKDWTATKRSLERHLEKDHRIRILSSLSICCKCNSDLGKRPKAHTCNFPSPQGLRRPGPSIFAFACTQCAETFPTTRGLRNHLEWHRDQANRQRNHGVLPRPATRQRRGQRADDGVDDPAVPPTDVGVEGAVPPSDVGVEGAVPPSDVGVEGAVPPTDVRVLPATISVDATAGPSNADASPGHLLASLADTSVPVTAGPSATPQPVRRIQEEDLEQSPLPSPSAEDSAVFSRQPASNLSINLDNVQVREEDRNTLSLFTPRPSNASERDATSRSAGSATQRQETRNSSPHESDHNTSQQHDGHEVIDVDDKSQIHEFLPQLNEILRSGTSEENWTRFEGILEEVTLKAQELVKIPVRRGSQKPTERPEDPRWIQKLYKRNRRKAMRLVLGEENRKCEIPKEDVTTHFRRIYRRKDCNLIAFEEQPPVERTSVATNRITPLEIQHRLQKAENTAPGDDRLTYKHWKTVDPACSVLATIFNICLKYEKIPEVWKTSTTVLIYKKGDPHDAANWRPIAIMRTIYKLYSGVLAKRVTTWIETNDVLAPAQKGFLPYDGVFEHNYILRRKLDKARTGSGEFIATWIDFSNAFGSVPHEAIFAGLRNSGAGAKFTNIIRDMYDGSTTRIMTSSGGTDNIDIQAGIKQGCPISALLFNIAIDPMIRRLQGDEPEHKILAYADDLVLMSKEPEDMQTMLSSLETLAANINIEVNVNKTYSLHFSGKTPVGTRNTTFKIGEEEVRNLKDGEFGLFLGKPVGFHIVADHHKLADIMLTADKILLSQLAPWQKLDALKGFLYPSLNFLMRTAQFSKGDWSKLDDYIRARIKTTLNVPQEASNHYIYGPSDKGCVGIPEAAADSDFHLVDNAFKLLSSKDLRTSELAIGDLQNIVQKRLGRLVDHQDVSAYLTGNNEGEFRQNNSGISSTWTQARKASARNKVIWEFENFKPAVTIGEKTLYHSQRHQVMSTFRKHRRAIHLDALLQLPSQGKAMDCVANERSSSHFLRTRDYKICRLAVHPPGKTQLAAAK